MIIEPSTGLVCEREPNTPDTCSGSGHRDHRQANRTKHGKILNSSPGQGKVPLRLNLTHHQNVIFDSFFVCSISILSRLTIYILVIYIYPSLTTLISAIIQSCQLSCPSGTGPAHALKERPLYNHLLYHSDYLFSACFTFDILFSKKAYTNKTIKNGQSKNSTHRLRRNWLHGCPQPRIRRTSSSYSCTTFKLQHSQRAWLHHQLCRSRPCSWLQTN